MRAEVGEATAEEGTNVMSEETNEPRRINVEASASFWEMRVSVGSIEVIPADAVKVEDSPTPRFLRLRAGDIRCYSHVSIRVDGTWHDHYP